MSSISCPAFNARRRRPLAHAFAALFNATLLAAQATTGHADEARAPRAPASVPVTTCADDLSDGSLREVLLHAVSGETVDMATLQCSSISLGYGALFVTVDDLTISGDRQTVYGGLNQNVLTHTGHGLLRMTAINLADSQYDGAGGCLYSAGSVDFENGSVHGCGASDAGGAFDIMGSLRLVDSVVSGNTVVPHTSYSTAGGALYVRGATTIVRSEIDDNLAVGNGTNGSHGGAIHALSNLYVQQSTFSGNSADVGGAISAIGPLSVIIDSTVSGNTSTNPNGPSAAFMEGNVQLTFDTIAFNTNAAGTATLPAAVFMEKASGVTPALTLDGTIISNSGQDVYDLYVSQGTVTGAHNLIVSANFSPADTLHVDPALAPLAENGNLYPAHPRTHALTPGSPAIDAGGSTLVGEDERGLPRIVGPAADVGAYEAGGDLIFTNGFD